jgi:hypothetical protein
MRGGGDLKVSLFTDRDLERLRTRLESGVEDDGTRMLFVRGEEKPEQDLCGLGVSGDVGEGTAGREGRTRLPGRPTRGKWWPLTRFLPLIGGFGVPSDFSPRHWGPG